MDRKDLYKVLMPNPSSYICLKEALGFGQFADKPQWDDEAAREHARQLFPFLHSISKEDDDG